jgi:predicted NUDIX family NTP pyrophosphohydrolase
VPKHSAGVLMYRRRGGALEVFLVHPGGPFWAGKDLGSWSLPKGEFTPGEDPLAAARREFQEETGGAEAGEFMPLTALRQPSGKIISAWAVEGDLDAGAVQSNTFSLEWPPRSGQYQEFPEIDRAGWFTLQAAREKIIKGQMGFLEELERMIAQAD